MSIERQAASGLKWSSVAKLGGQVVSWAVTLAVFRLLTPEDYGLMALSTVLISVVAGLAEFGLGSALVQAATLERRDLSRLAGALAALNIGCGIVIAVGSPLFAQLLGDARLTPILLVLAVQFLFTAIDAVPQSLAYRQMEFKKLAAIEVSATLLGALTTLLLAWWGAGVWALVFGNLVSAAVRTVLYVTFCGFVWPSFILTGIGRHLRFGGTITASRMVWQLTSQADILIGGRVLTREALGLYSVSTHLATLPMTKVMSIINQVAFPAVARLQDEMPRLRQRLLDALRMLALAAIPVLWGIFAVGPELVDVVLGEKWHAAIVALQLVSFITPLRMLTNVLATALQGIGRADLELRNTLTGAVVLPVSFLIGARYGLNGLAWSWLAAVPLLLVANLPRTLRALGFSFSDLVVAVRAPLIAGLAMCLAVTAARLPLAEVDELSRAPVLILVGAVVYLATVRMLDRTIWSDVQKLATALRG